MEHNSLHINSIESLFKEYYKTLCNAVNRIVRDRDASEDIVQDVFIKLWRKREEISINSSLKGYLLKAVSNAALNYLESNKAMKFNVEINEAVLDTYVAEVNNHLDHVELASKVESAINELPPKCRAIFILSRFEEMKYAEIAQQLNISVKTVENQMGIALEKLRRSLMTYTQGEYMFWPSLILLSCLIS